MSETEHVVAYGWKPPELGLGAVACAGCSGPIQLGDARTVFRGGRHCAECCCAACGLPLDAIGVTVSWLGKKYCSDGCANDASADIKHDTHKPRYDLIPPEALEAIAQVLTYGADKYEPRGWEKGARWGRYFAACMRHLWAWWRGEGDDPESGLPHLAHAACCVCFLLAYEMRGVGEDDRKVGDE